MKNDFKTIGELSVSKEGVVKKDGKEIRQRKNSQGYMRVCIYKNGKRSRLFVHRLVAKAFIPNPGNKREVNHKDGNALNNHAYNLEWVTPSENIQHAYDTGLRAPSPSYGEDCGTSKLTEKDVLYIRGVAKNSGRYYGRKALAKKFNVTENTIKCVVVGRTWGHI